MDIEDLKDIEKPIGDILLDNHIKCTHTSEGAYYHYREVCQALIIAKEAGKQEALKSLDFQTQVAYESGREARTIEIVKKWRIWSRGELKNMHEIYPGSEWDEETEIFSVEDITTFLENLSK